MAALYTKCLFWWAKHNHFILDVALVPELLFSKKLTRPNTSRLLVHKRYYSSLWRLFTCGCFYQRSNGFNRDDKTRQKLVCKLNFRHILGRFILMAFNNFFYRLKLSISIVNFFFTRLGDCFSVLLFPEIAITIHTPIKETLLYVIKEYIMIIPIFARNRGEKSA